MFFKYFPRSNMDYNVQFISIVCGKFTSFPVKIDARSDYYRYIIKYFVDIYQNESLLKASFKKTTFCIKLLFSYSC